MLRGGFDGWAWSVFQADDIRFGEIMDINMPRDQESGKPKGFAFLMYEDQRSTVLAVDNMNGALVLGRMLKVSLELPYLFFPPRIRKL